MGNWNSPDFRPLGYRGRGEERGKQESDFKLFLLQWQRWGIHFGEWVRSKLEAKRRWGHEQHKSRVRLLTLPEPPLAHP